MLVNNEWVKVQYIEAEYLKQHSWRKKVKYWIQQINKFLIGLRISNYIRQKETRLGLPEHLYKLFALGHLYYYWSSHLNNHIKLVVLLD